MDSHFENVTFDVIDQFMDRLSDRCLVSKDKFWFIWREMFNFPNKKEKVKREKKVNTKETKEVVQETKSKDKNTFFTKPKEKSEPKDSTQKPADSTQEQTDSTQPKDSTQEPKDCTQEPTDSTQEPKDSTQEPKDSELKPKEKPEPKDVKPKDVKPKDVKPKEKSEPKDVKPKEKSDKKDDACCFILTRGERSGKECGKPISKKKSDKFCITHCK